MSRLDDMIQVKHALVIGVGSIATGYLISKLVQFRSCLIGSSCCRKLKDCYYNEQEVVDQYLAMHYGSLEEQMGWKMGPNDSLDFPRKCVEFVTSSAEMTMQDSALDVGCAVGRAAFELSRHFGTVNAFDFSGKFIDVCQQLKTNGSVDYSIQNEGSLMDNYKAVVPQGCDRDRVDFKTGDACSEICTLQAVGGEVKKQGYDLVMASNLIDRLHRPMDFLKQLPHLVAVGGLVFISSPYSWNEQFTPKEHWLGANNSKDTTHNTRNALKDVMEGMSFQLVKEGDICMLIRETKRKHQWTVSHAMLFKKN